MLSKPEAIRACNDYNIDISNLNDGKPKQLGTTKIFMWFDGRNYFIRGNK